MLLQLLHTVFSFIVVLSVIVFVHEFGHYFVARLCGVRVMVFSIGFGRELFGWNDRHGTRWKISLLPLGGYVKMYGDASEASTADEALLADLPESEKQQTFHYKSLPKKSAIVAAGPVANFLLTIALITYFIMTTGLPSTEPLIGGVLPDSPAMEAGFQAGDRVLRVGETPVRRFNDIPILLATNLGTPVEVEILRQDKHLIHTLTPKSMDEKDSLGNNVKRPMIGIKSAEIKYENVGFPVAVWEAVKRTYVICAVTLEATGQMITGKRGISDLKGPVGIAKMSGQAANKGPSTILWLIAMLSANLGLVNLFPIPMLDGGHLVYYAAEAARGKPLARRVQEYGYRVGLAFIVMLMAITLFNDLRNIIFS